MEIVTITFVLISYLAASFAIMGAVWANLLNYGTDLALDAAYEQSEAASVLVSRKVAPRSQVALAALPVIIRQVIAIGTVEQSAPAGAALAASVLTAPLAALAETIERVRSTLAMLNAPLAALPVEALNGETLAGWTLPVDAGLTVERSTVSYSQAPRSTVSYAPLAASWTLAGWTLPGEALTALSLPVLDAGLALYGEATLPGDTLDARIAELALPALSSPREALIAELRGAALRLDAWERNERPTLTAGELRALRAGERSALAG